MSSRLFSFYENNFNNIADKVSKLIATLPMMEKDKYYIVNKEIEISFKELERGISQMEFETNSIKFPEAKNKLLTSLDSCKERYENLKKEINTEKTNDIVIPSPLVNTTQTKKKSETISIEINTKKDTDENIKDKYTITKVGFFTSMFHKIELKLIEMKKVYNFKQVLIPIVLILLFIILFIYFNFKGINKKTVNLK